jgi:hypothetical protein
MPSSTLVLEGTGKLLGLPCLRLLGLGLGL